MAEQTVSAVNNPALANQLVKDALAGAVPEEPKTPLKIVAPADGSVTLPGGFLNVSGEVITTAKVRELNGLDEEAIARQNSLGKAITLILSRAVVSVGSESATETLLDGLLAGDADALMLGIYRSTFGDTVTIPSFCSGCADVKQVEVDLSTDLEYKGLLDPIGDRVFTVKGKNTDYEVMLPSRKVQREMMHGADKTTAELNSILLEGCVLKIGSAPVFSKTQVQSINLSDRKTILQAISERNPGPKFQGVQVDCGVCGGKVDVPISLGAIFRS